MTPESYRDTGRAGDLVPEHFTPEPSVRPLHAAPDKEPRWQYVLQASADCEVTVQHVQLRSWLPNKCFNYAHTISSLHSIVKVSVLISSARYRA